MRKWWQVSGPGYLSQLSKAQIIAALKEANAMPARADKLQSWKKDALVKEAETRLAARNWLPALLRSRETPPDSDAIAEAA